MVFLLLIDAMSYQYLVGAEIDYKEDLQGRSSSSRTRTATTTCGWLELLDLTVDYSAVTSRIDAAAPS